MRVSIFTEPHRGATYGEQLRAARHAEAAGFEGFFRADHYLPMHASDGFPGPSDSWITLGALARETSTIRLGTLLTCATFRHPAVTAISVAQVDQISVAQVDQMSGGRKEHEAYGIPFHTPRRRFDLLEEQLAVITGLWSTRATLYARVAEACERHGRTRPPLVLSVGMAVACGRTEAEARRRQQAMDEASALPPEGTITGTPQQVVEEIARYAEIGATRVYVRLRDLADLDHLALSPAGGGLGQGGATYRAADLRNSG